MFYKSVTYRNEWENVFSLVFKSSVKYVFLKNVVFDLDYNHDKLHK